MTAVWFHCAVSAGHANAGALQLAPIAGTSLPVVAQLSSLRMPRGNRSAAQLAHLAYEMADAAAQHESVFTSAGLRPISWRHPT